MRVERPGDRLFGRALGGVLVAAGAGLGALVRGAEGALVGAAGGGLGAAALARQARRKVDRRRSAVAGPFPADWRRLLLERYDHYERLPGELRRRFEDDLRLFLAEKRITGIGIEATQELRLLVAASAVTLSVCWPDEDWDRLTEVLLYPQDFDRDWSFESGERAGEAHVWGTVILSAPTLEESFEHDDDAYHVGLHEFAHLLDLEQAQFGGMPAGLPRARAREWAALVETEMERLRQRKSALDPYGAQDPAEFFAVAVEAFFEIPQELRRRHAELYETLREYFRQDPAAWDDARW